MAPCLNFPISLSTRTPSYAEVEPNYCARCQTGVVVLAERALSIDDWSSAAASLGVRGAVMAEQLRARARADRDHGRVG